MIGSLIIAVILIIPFGAFAAQDYGSKGETETVNTFDELVNRYSDTTCKKCHQSVYEEWEKSYHSQSVVHSVGGMRNFIVHGVEKGWNAEMNKEHLMRCMDCHAPQLKDASDSLIREVAELIKKTVDQKDLSAKQKLSRLNVNCVICHNTKVFLEKNLKGEPKPGMFYGPTGKTTDAHGTQQSAVITSALFCGQCHGIYTPPDGDTVVCNTLYGSYQDAYRSHGGTETCQDCHMRAKNRGHTFPGAYEEDIVRDALDLDAQVVGLKLHPGKWVPAVVATVSLTNNAGHRIPDG